jgi:SAM-dependent methyltransferase
MLIPIAIIFLGAVFMMLLAILKFYTLSLYGLIVLLVMTCVYAIIELLEAYRVLIKGNAPYVRSSKKFVARIIQEVNFSKGATVYELGCGDGRFLRSLAKSADVNCVGYEYSLAPYLLAEFFNIFSKNKIKIIYKDFFRADLSDANYVFCYLMPTEMRKVESKLKKELRVGAIVISNTFSFVNWQPEKIITVKSSGKGLSNKIFIYKK